MTLLAELFRLERRYARSINLERDLTRPECLEGYVLTQRSRTALRRISEAILGQSAQRAWTLTGVYGTGKSAFAHFLTAFTHPSNHPMRQKAMEIAQSTLSEHDYSLLTRFPDRGLFGAVVVAQREPLSHTLVRGLQEGASRFWFRRKRPAIFSKLVDLEVTLSPEKEIEDATVVKLVKEIQEAAGVPIFFCIDELGKSLEYASQHQGVEDLYLLQQIAEMSSSVYVMGLLHQSFADYGQRLVTAQRNEWSKIQGRFEEIPFVESTEQMMQLMGQAIVRVPELDGFAKELKSYAQAWEAVTSKVAPELSSTLIDNLYPLHPIASIALPLLCLRYAQNDRSLFTFLTSNEPFSFQNFLNEEEASCQNLPTLKLHRVYDYFMEAAGSGLASRPNMQRWLEIQRLVVDAQHLPYQLVAALKTIGILNLVTATGQLRATPNLVAASLCNRSDDPREFKRWKDVLQELQDKGLVLYRRQMDELRVWEGSDFDVEAAIKEHIQQERTSLRELLDKFCPVKPLVAQRHSYQKGTLRYFEHRYLDANVALDALQCENTDADGLLGYWVDVDLPENIPFQTSDGKPLVVLASSKLDLLEANAAEYAALKTIQTDTVELQKDGVARLEVRQRLVHANQLLDEALSLAFEVSQCNAWVQGKPVKLNRASSLNSKLSDVCDSVYAKSPTLWNELINRRELTSQGAKARRELLEAMLEWGDRPYLGLEGYGPEVAMYYSLLEVNGIHRQEGDSWGFFPPQDGSGIGTLWEAIESFCMEATDRQQSLGELYNRLSLPPYGIKQGIVAIALAAVLLYHVDDVGFYKDGTFIPVMGPEHFELLVKDPARFSVKYFQMIGLRSQVFRELEVVLRSPKVKAAQGVRNISLLAIAKPLFGFVRKLPEYTRATKRLSAESLQVLRVLQTAQEPDELLFTTLPQACGFEPMPAGQDENEQAAKAFRQKLVRCFHEIQTAYDSLLADCQKLLYEAFGVRRQEANLREDLRVRASYLVGQCIEPSLRHFVMAAVNERSPDKEWLESLVRIVADKHPKGWVDGDFNRFEISLSDLVRRFQNLEALQAEVRRKGKGFDALRITVTEPNGQEVHEVVWIDEEYEDVFDRLVEDVLNAPELKNNPRLQKSFLAKLNAELLSRTHEDTVNEFGKPRNGQVQSAV